MLTEKLLQQKYDVEMIVVLYVVNETSFARMLVVCLVG